MGIGMRVSEHLEKQTVLMTLGLAVEIEDY